MEILASKDFELPRPKVLCWDIETSPAIVATWRKYESDALWVIQYPHIICWSVKYVGGKQITKALPDYPGYDSNAINDRALCEDLWRLLDACDVAIAHNGDKFDVRQAKARFIYHGFAPIPQIKTIDTVKSSKREFGFFSNKLDDIGDFLKLGRKESTGGYTLWKDCLSGDMKAWRRMRKYCAQDTRLLETIYLHTRSWDRLHPNMGVLAGIHDSCPKCTSTNLTTRGYRLTALGRTRRFQCKDCGGYSHGRHEKVTNIGP